MDFEAYKISENNYQIYVLEDNSRVWLASFNKLQTLINYYVHCHNFSNDTIMFTGNKLSKDEDNMLITEAREWQMRIRRL